MAYSHEKIKDVRIKFTSSLSTAFTAANASGWNANAAGWDPGATVFKVAAQSLDLSGLVDEGIVNEQVRNIMPINLAPIPGLAMGNIKMSIYAGNGSASTQAPFEATLLARLLAGTTPTSPTLKSDLTESGTSGTQIKATTHGLSAGDPVLVGTRGDGQGNAEVRFAETINSADLYTLNMALAGTPDIGDAVINGHYTKISTTTHAQLPVDVLIVLDSKVGDNRQALNCIGCGGSFNITGLGAGEIPMIELDLQVAKWRWETIDETGGGAAIEFDSTSAFCGNLSIANRSWGQFAFGDAASTTRTLVKVANVTFNTGMTVTPVPDPNGVNGIGDYIRTAYDPTLEFDIIMGDTNSDVVGLSDDYEAGTAKQCILQTGIVQQGCFAIGTLSGYLASKPSPTVVNGMDAVHVVFRLSGASNETCKLIWF